MSATTDDNESYRRQQEAAPEDAALIDRDDSSMKPTPAAAADQDQSVSTHNLPPDNKMPGEDDYQHGEWQELPPAFADTAEDNGDWMGLPPSFDDADYSPEEHLDDDQWHRADAAPIPDTEAAATVAPPPATAPAEAPPPEQQALPLTPQPRVGGWRAVGLAFITATVVGLVAFNAYTLVSENASLKTEIQRLQIQLDTATSPAAPSAEAVADEELRRSLMQRNESLENELANLEQGYVRLETELTDTLAAYKANNAALEEELLASRQQQAATVDPTPPTEAAGPINDTGAWFVNFGSYGQRALAQRWSEQLNVSTGTVILQEAVADGEAVYRVRVVGLATKSRADELARTLASKHQLPALWVGRD
ncbi:hypothetical protein CWI75_00875 [Kineobactrum sediminis]|uniref:SPOR domain-containing protein n=1 Tax=Kineobactrum sediminis TaxID=1905677 RepID=A0A2N5Y6B6_9GAMM|nr:SPOR domain-containing protein [Kineobactrum sediminis]PLW83943.1 hypothetical protein CWI75_00875 [Kineobactrum sediminis]